MTKHLETSKPAFALLIALLLFEGTALARPCPSKMPSHLYALTDELEVGVELRSFYFGVSVGDALPSTVEGERELEHNLFFALRPQVSWYPVENLSVILEAEMRYRTPGLDSHPVPGFDGRMNQAMVEYDAETFIVSAGLQSHTFGTAALLDQRFISVAGGYRHDLFQVDLFGGMIGRMFMRNAGNSLWMHYTAESLGWKFLSSRPYENFGAGLIARLNTLKPFRLSMLYLFSRPSVDELESHAASVVFSGPLIKKHLRLVAEGIAFLGDKHFVPGIVLELAAHIPAGPKVRVGLASTFGKKRRISSVYENLSWGLIQRYSLHDGHVAFLKTSYPIIKQVKPFVHYYLQSHKLRERDLSDELDAGADLSMTDLYRLRLAYVGLNLAGAGRASHAVYAELRLILGE